MPFYTIECLRYILHVRRDFCDLRRDGRYHTELYVSHYGIVPLDSCLYFGTSIVKAKALPEDVFEGVFYG